MNVRLASMYEFWTPASLARAAPGAKILVLLRDLALSAQGRTGDPIAGVGLWIKRVRELDAGVQVRRTGSPTSYLPTGSTSP